ncbi:MAG: hypothetical protein OFPI_00340 [Osedax symbiont Rs2]|nr:MAG: hypothetical protein OFPI_00340 [Osedax symbiont Rs2]
MNKRYQVFVSSTYLDLKEERQEVTKNLMALDCIPAGMELFGAIDIAQFDFIKTVIDDCDYYLLIIGARYGSTSDQGISFTEMEYDYAVSKGIPVIALLHSNIGSVIADKSELNPESRAKLDKFRDKVQQSRLTDTWSNSSELSSKAILSIHKMIKMFPAIGWIRADQGSSIEVLEQINNLRIENDQLKLELSKPGSITDTNKFAQGDEELTIHGASEVYDSRHNTYEEKSWSYVISWDDIIKLIGPYLLTPTSEYDLQKILATESKQDHADIITDKSWHQIHIQLLALRIIVSDDDSLLVLTPHGKQLLMEILSIKSDKPAPLKRL